MVKVTDLRIEQHGSVQAIMVDLSDGYRLAMKLGLGDFSQDVFAYRLAELSIVISNHTAGKGEVNSILGVEND